jgi:hypothetical protein
MTQGAGHTQAKELREFAAERIIPGDRVRGVVGEF